MKSEADVHIASSEFLMLVMSKTLAMKNPRILAWNSDPRETEQ
jgi:hypothetical protein